VVTFSEAVFKVEEDFDLKERVLCAGATVTSDRVEWVLLAGAVASERVEWRLFPGAFESDHAETLGT